MASTEGGVEIEEVARTAPEKILKVVVDPLIGLQPFQARDVAFALGLSGSQVSQFAKLMTGAYRRRSSKTILRCSRSIRSRSAATARWPASMRRLALIRTRCIAYATGPRCAVKARRRELAASIRLNYVALEGNIGCADRGAGSR